MKKITIFTATYNRGYIIENLYRSLQRQTVFDFEWLVINDGSTDDTDNLFHEWLMEENPFPIRYFKQENSGLIAGLNKGITLAEGEYLAKIDSDDYISDDCIEFFLKGIESVKGNSAVYAVGGMRGTEDGDPMKGKNEWPKIDSKIGYLDLYDYERGNFNLDADMCEAWKVEILRQFPFPKFEGESFAPEEIVFNQIALCGNKIRWFEKIICICKYQDDGLTKNELSLQKNNPLGFSMMWKSKLNLKSNLKQKIFWLCQSGAMVLYSGKVKYIWKDNSYKLLATILLPASFIIFLRRRKQFKNC